MNIVPATLALMLRKRLGFNAYQQDMWSVFALVALTTFPLVLTTNFTTAIDRLALFLFIHRFEHRGVPSESIDRMTCPIGVGPVAGKEPEVIAMAVVAQLLQQQAAATTARPARTASATTP